MNFEGLLNDDWSLSKPIVWPKLKKRIDRLVERTDKLVIRVKSEQLRSEAKIKSEELTSINNSRNLPSNVTIRHEYVKCGKSDCPEVKHGPYYYAYWKDDKRKLHKKYIGKYAPACKNTNKDGPSCTDHACNDNISNNSKGV